MIVLEKFSEKFLKENITTFVVSFKFTPAHRSALLLVKVWLAFLLAVEPLSAGFERTAQPVSLMGSAFSAIFAEESESILVNPSSAGSLGSFHLSIFYTPSPFELPQLSNCGVVAAYPFESLRTAVSLTSTGFSLYRELTATTTLARGFDGILFVGLNFNINHLTIAHYGSATAIGIDLAAAVQVTEDLRWGFSLLNVNRPSIGGEDGKLPEVYITGVSCQLMPTANISFSLVKDVCYPTSLRTGVEFSLVEIIRLRIGVSTEPSRYCAGIGVRVSPVSFDYGVATHEDLGLTHSLGLSMTF